MKTRSAATAMCPSDDDGPEEVSLVTGRNASLAQRRAETKVVAQQNRAAKERRKAGSEARSRNSDLGADTVPSQDVAEGYKLRKHDRTPSARAVEERAVADPAENAEDAGQGLAGELPADIIAALLEKRREAAAEAPVPSQSRQEHAALMNKGHKKRKRVHITKLEAGPLTVEVIDKVSVPTVSGSALAFQQGRLVGDTRKRSYEMLTSRQDGMYRPAAVFSR